MPGNLIATTTGDAFTDATPPGSYCKLGAVDRHGNVSPYAIAYLEPGGVPGGTTPVAWIGDAWPNPSRVSIFVPLRLAASGEVALHVWDSQGRVVYSRRQMFEAGPARIAWDGRTSHEGAAPSGTYFLSAEHSSVRRTMRVTFVR